jgi:hypothetical protein
MDFLDPEKQRSQQIRLVTGYVLIGIAILIVTYVLLQLAFGFWVDKNGQVIQNGFVFVSSGPDKAKIFLDGKQQKAVTNTKLQLPEGKYAIELQREGYRNWKRIVTVQGGNVYHYDYPKLVPSKLTTNIVKTYPDTPGLATASPDRRWLVVQNSTSLLSLDLYDVANPKKVTEALTTVNLAETLLTSPKTGTHAWRLVEWSTNNRHVLLQHVYTVPSAPGEQSEYILVDTRQPAESQNLTRALSLPAGHQLSLRDKKFDRYYVHDPAARTIGYTSINEAGKVTPVLNQVAAFKTYGADVVLYISDHDPATGQPLPAGKVNSYFYDDGQTYRIRDHGASPPYLIDLAEYDRKWYVVAGASGDGKVYVYENPQHIRKASATAALVPVQIMRLQAPNRVQFSSNTQFIMVENGQSFAAYDAENDKGYRYDSPLPIDAPAKYATWMDGHRLTYTSGGKVVFYDYDNLNPQMLVSASSAYLPFYDRDYETLYTLTPSPATADKPAAGMTLTSTSMLLPEDQ